MHENHKGNTFWFGFSLGAATIGIAGFLFGTKKGRETLGKLLEISENLEENLINMLKELEKVVLEEGEIIKGEFRKTSTKAGPTFSNILDKISHFSNTSEKGKKFFVKEK